MSKIIKNSNNSYTNGYHNKYLSRITKSFYYGKLPKTECLSFPVTELAVEIFSEAKKGKSLERLHYYKAAEISRNACVAPCSLVLAILYLERLKKCNPQYLDKISPSDLFLVSLMVSSKFLFDDGEGDEVFLDEWATSGGLNIRELVRLEKNFLSAINWEIFVSNESFYSKLHEMEIKLALKQGMSRGNFTYTELDILSPLIEIHRIIQCVTAITTILILTYVAGFLTILGSVYLTSQVPGTSLYIKKMEKPVESTWEPDFIKKTDLDNKYRTQRVLDMLKTSIFLASIKSNSTESMENVQNITWDYWNNPVMDWLARSSQIVTDFATDFHSNYLPYYIETTVHNMKYMQLEDHIHKATKTRIQDQMESSWHVEWIESIKNGVVYTELVTLTS